MNARSVSRNSRLLADGHSPSRNGMLRYAVPLLNERCNGSVRHVFPLFPSVKIGRMWKVRPLTLSIDQPMSDKADIQPGMLRIVETGELLKEAKVVLIFIDQPRNRVVGIDYHYFLPFQMNVEHVAQLDALKMSCGNVAWTDVALTLTTEKVTDNPNY